jgi:hypothetical protein
MCGHVCVWTGALRGSYVGHNHLDELETSNSVAFSAQGDKIFSGSNRMIRCDVMHVWKLLHVCSTRAVQ